MQSCQNSAVIETHGLSNLLKIHFEQYYTDTWKRNSPGQMSILPRIDGALITINQNIGSQKRIAEILAPDIKTIKAIMNTLQLTINKMYKHCDRYENVIYQPGTTCLMILFYDNLLLKDMVMEWKPLWQFIQTCTMNTYTTELTGAVITLSETEFLDDNTRLQNALNKFIETNEQTEKIGDV